MKCPECKGSSQIRQSTVPGMLKCGHCGNLFVGEIEQPKAEPTEVEFAETGDFIVPDLTEFVHGWRAWNIHPPEHGGDIPVLRSVSHSSARWLPRTPCKAECPYGRGRKNGQNPRGAHKPPDENCTCGLYAAKTYEHLLSLGNRYHAYNQEHDGIWTVVGRVRLWGDVMEGTQGWRAEYGYPDLFLVPFEAHELIEPLEDVYGIECELNNFLGKKIPIKKKE